MVQDEPRTHCAVPVYLASSDSNASDSLPRIYCPERNARRAASSTSAPTKHRDKGIFCILVFQFDGPPRASRFVGRFQNTDRFVAGPSIGSRRLPGLHRLNEGAQFGLQRFLGRAFHLVEGTLNRLELFSFLYVFVGESLDFVLRGVVIAKRTQFAADDSDIPEFAR